jgi:hypothetical protein
MGMSYDLDADELVELDAMIGEGAGVEEAREHPNGLADAFMWEEDHYSDVLGPASVPGPAAPWAWHLTYLRWHPWDAVRRMLQKLWIRPITGRWS